MSTARKGMGKITNEYSQAFGRLYARTPKAVFAAVAFSYASSGTGMWDRGVKQFLREWQVLFHNGIVPQKPPKLGV